MLKIIAIILMTLDHIGCYFQVYMPSEVYWVLRAVGRLAFPIFCYYLACGYQRTHNLSKYFFRLSFFALLSEPVLYYSFNLAGFSYDSRNIFFTLVCALIFLGGLDIFLQNIDVVKRNSTHYKGIIFGLVTMICACMIGRYFMVDYGIYGVMLPGVFYFAQRFSLRGLDMNYTQLLYKIQTDGLRLQTGRQLIKRTRNFALVGMYILTALFMLLDYFLHNVFPFPSIQILAILSIFICYIPGLQKSTANKPSVVQQYFFYIYYPLHIFILGFIVSRL